MIDTWSLDQAFKHFKAALPRLTPEQHELAKRVDDEIYEVGDWECDENHHIDESGDPLIVLPAKQYLSDLLTRVRMGVYSEAQHGSLQDVLEEIERLLP